MPSVAGFEIDHTLEDVARASQRRERTLVAAAGAIAIFGLLFLIVAVFVEQRSGPRFVPVRATTVTTTSTTRTFTTTTTTRPNTTTTTTTSGVHTTTTTTLTTATTTATSTSLAIITDAVVTDPLRLPTRDEFKEFVDVTNFSADLHRIGKIGRNVFNGLDNASRYDEWKATFASQKFASETRFIHRQESALLKRRREPWYGSKRLAGTTVVIVGAGPGGLRLAVELCLFGATVHIIESRTTFSRYNVLKLWKFTELDLVGIGVLDLYTKLLSYQVKRVPIAILQHTLLRVALTLGAQIHPACEIGGLSISGEPGSTLKVRDGCPSSNVLESLRPHAIIDGTGTRAVLRNWRANSTEKPLIESHRKDGKKEAIGITMNFRRFSQKAETDFLRASENDERFKKYNPARRDEFNLACLYAQEYCRNKSALLINIVYWKSEFSHYCVMTVSRDVLFNFGVLDRPVGRSSFSGLTKHQEKLVEFGLLVAEEWNIPHLNNSNASYKDIFITDGRGNPDISMFEYGLTKLADESVRFIDDGLFFGLVGDSVETPFWPLGTGANHAVYSAYMQALALVAWRGYHYSQGETAKLAKDMLQSLQRMPVEGNKDTFKQIDYDTQIATNYANVGFRKAMLFY
eukprot:TRINITY_DN13079_c1_g3_i1.p1 TRINITY_DN13079_c1_g3~~TRINITY_DN13079_c1_g3_i1.p1  ORF type:complete len:631 (-),score=50.85 TRINITY_DN13079_c1_g3_i1:300-2192(-)